ncbi:MAG: hypothetical protein ACNA70_08325 [Brevefilum sp.]
MKSSTKLIPITGFIILSIMVTILLLTAANEAWVGHPAVGILASLIAIGTFIEIFLEGKSLLQEAIAPIEGSRKFFEFLAVVVGGGVTFYLSRDIGLGAVVASGLIGVLAAMIVPKYGAPAYCGSFVGMSSSALFFSHTEVALASIIAGIVYVISRDIFPGFGGKLGTIAFTGATLAAFIFGREFLITPISDWNTNLWVLALAIIAAPLTFYLNCNLGNGAVLASGAVGLVGGLILPVLFPQIGNQLAVVVICASFTGMSNTKRCPRFWHMFVAGLFTGILFIFSTPLLGGAGGKLGTIAFASIISVDGWIYLSKKVYGNDARQTTDPVRR